jgi:hypothetical protein
VRRRDNLQGKTNPNCPPVSRISPARGYCPLVWAKKVEFAKLISCPSLCKIVCVAVIEVRYRADRDVPTISDGIGVHHLTLMVGLQKGRRGGAM